LAEFIYIYFIISANNRTDALDGESYFENVQCFLCNLVKVASASFCCWFT